MNKILGMTEGTVSVVIAVGAFTGLRLGEICALKPGDVDLDGGVIRVRAGKTAAAVREVPIHPRLADILHDYDGFKGEYLFNAPASNRYPDGKHHLNPRTVNTDFQELAEQVGLLVGRKNQGVTFHSLRRFFKTVCLNAGVPLPLVDRWLGHSNKNDINFHYFRPTQAEEAQWLSAIDFGNTSTP